MLVVIEKDMILDEDKKVTDQVLSTPLTPEIMEDYNYVRTTIQRSYFSETKTLYIDPNRNWIIFTEIQQPLNLDKKLELEFERRRQQYCYQVKINFHVCMTSRTYSLFTVQDLIKFNRSLERLEAHRSEASNYEYELANNFLK